MANNTFSGTDGIVINTNNIGIIVHDTSNTAGTLRISSSNSVDIGYEQMKTTDKKCTIVAAGDVEFADSSRTFGNVYGMTGAVCLFQPTTSAEYGFYITLNSTEVPLLSIPSTDTTNGFKLYIGNTSCGEVNLMAGQFVRLCQGLTTSTVGTGIYSNNGTTDQRFMYFNTGKNLIIGSSNFATTNVYYFGRYNSYIRITAGTANVFYAGATSCCRNNVNVPGGIAFTVGATNIAPVAVTVTRNTTNTTAMTGYGFYYPLLNIVQLNLCFTMAALTASTIYTLGTISNTAHRPITTAGLACHVNMTADHSTGIINSAGTISLYADAAGAAGKYCYISGIYSTV